jgi:hypothetical protein
MQLVTCTTVGRVWDGNGHGIMSFPWCGIKALITRSQHFADNSIRRETKKEKKEKPEVEGRSGMKIS